MTRSSPNRARRIAFGALLATGLLAAAFGLVSVGSSRARPANVAVTEVPELSGLAKSHRFPGLFWGHGDSGNDPVLWAIDAEGRTHARFTVEAPNKDWEDLAADDQGHLFIGDIGNNWMNRDDLVVYRVREPESLEAGGVLPVEARLRFRYPDQREEDRGFFGDTRFDAEALFFAEGRLYILTKHWDDPFATLYRFPLEAGAPGAGVVTLERLGDLDLRFRAHQRVALVTGASASPDGSRLAVLTYERLFLYRFGPEGMGERLGIYDFGDLDGVEAVAWDGEGALVGSEDGDLVHVSFEVAPPSGERASREGSNRLTTTARSPELRPGD